MNRRKFLAFLGVGSVVSTVVVPTGAAEKSAVPTEVPKGDPTGTERLIPVGGVPVTGRRLKMFIRINGVDISGDVLSAYLETLVEPVYVTTWDSPHRERTYGMHGSMLHLVLTSAVVTSLMADIWKQGYNVPITLNGNEYDGDVLNSYHGGGLDHRGWGSMDIRLVKRDTK
jgi:hypothetical protein